VFQDLKLQPPNWKVVWSPSNQWLFGLHLVIHISNEEDHPITQTTPPKKEKGKKRRLPKREVSPKRGRKRSQT